MLVSSFFVMFSLSLSVFRKMFLFQELKVVSSRQWQLDILFQKNLINPEQFSWRLLLLFLFQTHCHSFVSKKYTPAYSENILCSKPLIFSLKQFLILVVPSPCFQELFRKIFRHFEVRGLSQTKPQIIFHPWRRESLTLDHREHLKWPCRSVQTLCNILSLFLVIAVAFGF